MHFSVETQLSEISTLLSRAIAITGAATWTQREKDFSRQIAQNPLIGRYLDIQFTLERAMIHARRRLAMTGRLPSPLDPSGAALGALYSFATMTAHVFSRLPPAARDSLRRRLTGALKDNIGLAPVAFEMRTATHFMAVGYDVEFNDICNGGGFDFLARNKTLEIEIECKSVSGDLGHQIHLLRQYQLGPYLVNGMTASRKTGFVQLIIATLPDRFHAQREFMTAVANRILEAVKERQNYDDYGPCSISYKEFPIKNSPFDCTSPPQITEHAVADYFKRVANDEDVGHTIMTFSPRRSATVVALRSATPDKFLRALHRNLREAAASQLSGTRPGMICVQLRNLTDAQLREVAAAPMQTGKPNGLQRMTADFFAGNGRRHVHTLAYAAPGEFSQNRTFQLDPSGSFLVRNTVIGEDAASYTFINKNHPQAEAPEYRVFDRPKQQS